MKSTLQLWGYPHDSGNLQPSFAQGAAALPPRLGLRPGGGLSAAALRRLQAPGPRGRGSRRGWSPRRHGLIRGLYL